MTRKVTIIFTPDDPECHVNMDTGTVGKFEILDMLKSLLTGLSKQITLEAEKDLGTSDFNELEEYLNFLRKNELDGRHGKG